MCEKLPYRRQIMHTERVNLMIRTEYLFLHQVRFAPIPIIPPTEEAFSRSLQIVRE